MPILADLLLCLRFLSRLPVPETARERALGAAGFATAAAMAPAAGLVLALPAAGVVAAASALRLPPFMAAILALAVLVAVTGALHEDAVADCADGFGGGRSRLRKLEIMRDSAIGSYGAVAIALSLLLRTGCLAAAIGAGRGVAALLVAATVSRAACLLPLAILPPARRDGSGAAAAVAPARALGAAALAVGLVVALTLASGTEPWRTTAAFLLAAAAAAGVSALAWRQIGGQTGDVAGAALQASETAVLLVFAAGAA